MKLSDKICFVAQGVMLVLFALNQQWEAVGLVMIAMEISDLRMKI